jgi:hypothetical protein
MVGISLECCRTLPRLATKKWDINRLRRYAKYARASTRSKNGCDVDQNAAAVAAIHRIFLRDGTAFALGGNANASAIGRFGYRLWAQTHSRQATPQDRKELL